MKTNQSPVVGGRSLLPLIVLVAVAGIALFFVLRRPSPAGLPSLSGATLETIHALREPVEIRFYRNAGGSAPTAAISDFGNRTRSLLSAYEKASAGRISALELPVKSNEDASKAAADGIRPFNIEKGDAAWLGMALQMGSSREVIPLLSLEFEQALEADITRALQRLVTAKRMADSTREIPESVGSDTVERVKALVPDYREVSLEKASDKIRESMLSDMHKAGAEFDAKMTEMRAAMDQAADNPAEQERLRRVINETGAAHTERLKEIVSSATSQLKALQRLKTEQ